ncbi:hypothetical protein MRB53_010993 [Persea americana]|uniref:Uncharacterized protein n=1 Tax=Persea americana TaxID=3435 RepID=A0ACC2LUI8_PERAE|nr:hypothetical protein MRB53_010993 [Persea americana]
MPWLCNTIYMMLGVAINSDQRKRLTALPAVVMPVYGALALNTINRLLPSSKMPWSCSTISTMLGVAIDFDQRKRLIALPAVYGALAPNTINRQLPSSKMPWLCSTISMMLGVAIDSDQRKKLTASPIWERSQDTNPKAKSEEFNVLHTISSPPTLIYLSKHLPSFKCRGRRNQQPVPSNIDDGWETVFDLDAEMATSRRHRAEIDRKK